MSLRVLLIALLLGLSGLVAPATSNAAVAPADATAVPALSPVRITIDNMVFSPSFVRIRRGRTVVWKNNDSMAHSIVVTSGPRTFQSPILDPGESFSKRFRVRGLYSYKCGLHPSMTGSVRVR